MLDFAAARKHMVDSQIRTNRVTDERIIEALREIPRERFAADQYRNVAYIDEDLPVAEGRYLMEPLVLARMIQALEIGPEDVVLEIGCATGYGSAILSRLALTVVALECDPGLAAKATENLSALGADNAVVMEGDLRNGYPDQAPYDAILLHGAVDRLSDGICDQLSEGGRLCVVMAVPGGMGRATLMVRSGDTVSHRVLFDAAVPLLRGFEVAPGFEF